MSRWHWNLHYALYLSIFLLNHRFDSEGNSEVTGKLASEVLQLYNGKWAEGTVKGTLLHLQTLKTPLT